MKSRLTLFRFCSKKIMRFVATALIWNLLDPTFAPIEHVLSVLPSGKSPSLLIGSMDIAMAQTGTMIIRFSASAQCPLRSGRWGNRPASLWIAEDFGCCASG
jgi:hypothetical protein